MRTIWRIEIAVFALMLAAPAAAQDRFLLLAANRTGTMQDELNAAGANGYRFAGTQGGETAFGGNEVVVVMERDPEERRFRYILLATSRTGTLQRELNGVPPEFNVVGMTVFSSTFGGKEAAGDPGGRGIGVDDGPGFIFIFIFIFLHVWFQCHRRTAPTRSRPKVLAST